jgi:hypothetical protein
MHIPILEKEHKMSLETLGTLWSYYWSRFSVARHDDRGEVNLTTVILAFVLAGLAITVGAIIVAKVTGKANSIPTD